jgi:hypothetical protein
MNFDLRLPLGLMFTTFGLILICTGFFGSDELWEKSLGINMNLWWGFVVLLFGVSMLGLTWRATKGK